MKTAWGMKPPHKRKQGVRRTKVRWEKLGLMNPPETSSALSIEDIRRQVVSAANQGLSTNTVARSQQSSGRPKAGSKSPNTTRKRGTASI